ncbi:MAG: hypothetical protein KYX62_02790 [Pseudomonadota bacterium]|nr:hypothetical protein [Pseudomonadota bacterium]
MTAIPNICLQPDTYSYADNCVAPSSPSSTYNTPGYGRLLVPEIIDKKYEIPTHNEITNRKKTEEKALTVKSMVIKIRETLGLNVAQVAEVVGVSRPTLYNHLSAKEEPKNIEAYYRVYNLAAMIDSEFSSSLKTSLKSVLINGKSLLSHLKEKELTDKSFLEIARTAYNSTQNRVNSEDNNISDEEQKRIVSAISKQG